MEAKGKMTAAAMNIDTGNTCLTFEFAGLRPESFEDIRNTELRIKAVKWREKRSLTANAYFHVIVSKIAEAVGISAIMAKNMMIARYGQIYLTDEGMPLSVPVLDSVDYRKVAAIHLQPTTKTALMNGNLYRWHIVMLGSHLYDSKQMARLIDGTVEDAKELGIDTLPPDELERMLKAWGKSKAC